MPASPRFDNFHAQPINGGDLVTRHHVALAECRPETNYQAQPSGRRYDPRGRFGDDYYGYVQSTVECSKIHHPWRICHDFGTQTDQTLTIIAPDTGINVVVVYDFT